MAGAAVAEGPSRGSMTAQKTVLTAAPGTRAANRSRRRRTCAGRPALQQQRPGRAAQLAHHGGRGQPAADDVADDHAVAAVGQVDDVVPVAADLQRPGGRLVADRELGGQGGRPEDGALQRDGDHGEERSGTLELGPLLGAPALGLDGLRVGDRGGDLAGGQARKIR